MFYDKVMTFNHKTFILYDFKFLSGKDAQKLLYAEAIFVCCFNKQIILLKISISI